MIRSMNRQPLARMCAINKNAHVTARVRPTGVNLNFFFRSRKIPSRARFVSFCRVAARCFKIKPNSDCVQMGGGGGGIKGEIICVKAAPTPRVRARHLEHADRRRAITTPIGKFRTIWLKASGRGGELLPFTRTKGPNFAPLLNSTISAGYVRAITSPTRAIQNVRDRSFMRETKGEREKRQCRKSSDMKGLAGPSGREGGATVSPAPVRRFSAGRDVKFREQINR